LYKINKPGLHAKISRPVAWSGSKLREWMSKYDENGKKTNWAISPTITPKGLLKWFHTLHLKNWRTVKLRKMSKYLESCGKTYQFSTIHSYSSSSSLVSAL
jgi:hypothetical protein